MKTHDEDCTTAALRELLDPQSHGLLTPDVDIQLKQSQTADGEIFAQTFSAGFQINEPQASEQAYVGTLPQSQQGRAFAHQAGSGAGALPQPQLKSQSKPQLKPQNKPQVNQPFGAPAMNKTNLKPTETEKLYYPVKNKTIVIAAAAASVLCAIAAFKMGVLRAEASTALDPMKAGAVILLLIAVNAYLASRFLSKKNLCSKMVAAPVGEKASSTDDKFSFMENLKRRFTKADDPAPEVYSFADEGFMQFTRQSEQKEENCPLEPDSPSRAQVQSNQQPPIPGADPSLLRAQAQSSQQPPIPSAVPSPLQAQAQSGHQPPIPGAASSLSRAQAQSNQQPPIPSAAPSPWRAQAQSDQQPPIPGTAPSSSRAQRGNPAPQPPVPGIEYTVFGEDGSNETTLLRSDDTQKTVLLRDTQQQDRIKLLPVDTDTYREISVTTTPFIIGKQKAMTDARIDNPTVSKLHAKLIKEDKDYYICDLNSTNGTFVNGVRLGINAKSAVQDGDTVTFSDISYRVVMG
jgi:hypothetical protein